MATGAAAGAAAAAARLQAVKACGVVVYVESAAFQDVLLRQQGPLVVQASGGLFWTEHQYLTTYKGLAFYAKSPTPLTLPPGCEIVQAKSIWAPG
jgi:hypothetical protein